MQQRRALTALAAAAPAPVSVHVLEDLLWPAGAPSTNALQATISKLESGEPATRMAVLFDALAALGLEITVTPRGGKSNFEDMF